MGASGQRIEAEEVKLGVRSRRSSERKKERVKKHRESSPCRPTARQWSCHDQSLSVLLTIQSVPSIAAIALAQIVDLSPQTQALGCLMAFMKRFEGRKRRWSVS